MRKKRKSKNKTSWIIKTRTNRGCSKISATTWTRKKKDCRCGYAWQLNRNLTYSPTKSSSQKRRWLRSSSNKSSAQKWISCIAIVNYTSTVYLRKACDISYSWSISPFQGFKQPYMLAKLLKKTSKKRRKRTKNSLTTQVSSRIRLSSPMNELSTTNSSLMRRKARQRMPRQSLKKLALLL